MHAVFNAIRKSNTVAKHVTALQYRIYAEPIRIHRAAGAPSSNDKGIDASSLRYSSLTSTCIAIRSFNTSLGLTKSIGKSVYRQRIQALASSSQQEDWKELKRISQEEFGFVNPAPQQIRELNSLLANTIEKFDDLFNDKSSSLSSKAGKEAKSNVFIALPQEWVLSNGLPSDVKLANKNLKSKDGNQLEQSTSNKSSVHILTGRDCVLVSAATVVSFIEQSILQTIALFQVIGLRHTLPKVKKTNNGTLSNIMLTPQALSSSVVTQYVTEWVKWTENAAAQARNTNRKKNFVVDKNSELFHLITAIENHFGLDGVSEKQPLIREDCTESKISETSPHNSSQFASALPEGLKAALFHLLPSASLSRVFISSSANEIDDNFDAIPNESNVQSVSLAFDRVFVPPKFPSIQFSNEDRSLFSALRESISSTLGALSLANSSVKFKKVYHPKGEDNEVNFPYECVDHSNPVPWLFDERLLTEFNSIIVMSATQTMREVGAVKPERISKGRTSPPSKSYSPLSFAASLQNDGLIPENIPKRLPGTLEFKSLRASNETELPCGFDQKLGQFILESRELGPLRLASIARYTQAIVDQSWYQITRVHPFPSSKEMKNELRDLERHNPVMQGYVKHRLSLSSTVSLLLVHLTSYASLSKLASVLEDWHIGANSEAKSSSTNAQAWSQMLHEKSLFYNCLRDVDKAKMEDLLWFMNQENNLDSTHNADNHQPDHMENLYNIAIGEPKNEQDKGIEKLSLSKKLFNKISYLLVDDNTSEKKIEDFHAQYLVLPDLEKGLNENLYLKDSAELEFPGRSASFVSAALDKYLLLLDAVYFLSSKSDIHVLGAQFARMSIRLQMSWFRTVHLIPFSLTWSMKERDALQSVLDRQLLVETNDEKLEIAVNATKEVLSSIVDEPCAFRHASMAEWIYHVVRVPIATIYSLQLPFTGELNWRENTFFGWLKYAGLPPLVLNSLATKIILSPESERLRAISSALHWSLDFGEKQRQGFAPPVSTFVPSPRLNSVAGRYSALSSHAIATDHFQTSSKQTAWQRHTSRNEQHGGSTDTTISTSLSFLPAPVTPVNLLALCVIDVPSTLSTKLRYFRSGENSIKDLSLFAPESPWSQRYQSRYKLIADTLGSAQIEQISTTIRSSLELLELASPLRRGISALTYANGIAEATKQDAVSVAVLAIALGRSIEKSDCGSVDWQSEDIDSLDQDDEDQNNLAEELDNRSNTQYGNDDDDVIPHLDHSNENTESVGMSLSEKPRLSLLNSTNHGLSDAAFLGKEVLALGFQKLLELGEPELAWQAYLSLPSYIRASPYMIRIALKAFSVAASSEPLTNANWESSDPSLSNNSQVKMNSARNYLLSLLDALIPYLRRDDIAASMIKAALAGGLPSEAERVEAVWRETQYGRKLPSAAFHSWIRFYANQDDVLGISQTLNKMISQGYLEAEDEGELKIQLEASLRDDHTLGENHVWSQLLFSPHRFDSLRRHATSDQRSRLIQNAAPFGIMLNSLIRKGQMQEAIASLQQIVRYKVTPDLTLSTLALKTYLHVDDMVMVRCVLVYLTHALRVKETDFIPVFNIAFSFLLSKCLPRHTSPSSSPTSRSSISSKDELSMPDVIAYEVALASITLLSIVRALGLYPTTRSYDPLLRILLFHVRDAIASNNLLTRCGIEQDYIIIDGAIQPLRGNINSALRAITNSQTQKRADESDILQHNPYSESLHAALLSLEQLHESYNKTGSNERHNRVKRSRALSKRHVRPRNFMLHAISRERVKEAVAVMVSHRDRARQQQLQQHPELSALHQDAVSRAWEIVELYANIMSSTSSDFEDI